LVEMSLIQHVIILFFNSGNSQLNIFSLSITSFNLIFTISICSGVHLFLEPQYNLVTSKSLY